MVEDVLTTDMVAKLMRYMRIHIIGNINVKTGSHVENKTLISGIRRKKVGHIRRMHLGSLHMEKNWSSMRLGIEKVDTDE